MTSIATPIAEDSHDALVEKLADGELSTLVMVLVQLTGDMALLDRYAPMLSRPGEFDHKVPEHETRQLFERLANVLLDPGYVPPRLSPDQLHRMMNAFCREEVSERYLPMLFEDLGFVPAQAPLANISAPARKHALEFSVLVVGAGASGICAGIRLGQAGIRYKIIERNPDVGGVWHENTYPDCGVDSANHLYCYSFALNHNWSRYYVRQQELKGYLKECATRFGVIENIAFGREVVSLRFDTDELVWRCTIREPDGTKHVETANAVISSVGQLNQPAIPKLAGLDQFAGPKIHTARWDHDYDFAGKRVAMVGTGASGIQAGPPLAQIAEHFTIFQRSAPWIIPRHNYANLVADNVKWILANVPHYAQWYRFLLFWAYGDGVHDALIRDPEWKGGAASISQRSESIRKLWTAYIDATLADRPDLRAKVTPDYAPFGKRSLRDNGWYDMLRRDNVELVTDAIDHVEADAIVDKTGTRHPVDAIVFATGFQASRMLFPMEVTGATGNSLRALWGEDDPRAYLGVSVPGFPNLFLTYGPNTNLAHGGSIIFQAECQVHYITACIEMLLESGARAMDCTHSAHDAYNDRLDAALSRMVWTHEGVTNWYQNKSGRITTNSPWRLIEYWEMTRGPDPDAFTLFGEQPQ